MAILKYYKVDSDGKIKRLRRECPQVRTSLSCSSYLPRLTYVVSLISPSAVPVSSWPGTRTVRPAESAVSPTPSAPRDRPSPTKLVAQFEGGVLDPRYACHLCWISRWKGDKAETNESQPVEQSAKRVALVTRHE